MYRSWDTVTVTNEVEVMTTAHDLAAALAETPTFRAFEQAIRRLYQDEAARAAIRAFQGRQRQVQKGWGLGIFDRAERAELERLRQAVEAQPAVIGHRNAEESLRLLCQAVNGVVSKAAGLDFVAMARRSSCCG